jgi:DUF1009 family protein
MKTYVQFNADGKIHSIVTIEAPDGVRAMVDVEPGLSVAEIDTAEFKAAATDADVEKISALTQDYRVSVPAAAKATLTKAK